MSEINLVYVHQKCPQCNAEPLMAWVVPADFDEDGHSNDIEVDKIECRNCGELCDDVPGIEQLCQDVIGALYSRDDIGEIGSIYSYFPKNTQ